jgi:hypothetical protein
MLLCGCGSRGDDRLHGTWEGETGIGEPAILQFGPGKTAKIQVGTDTNEGTYRVDWSQDPAHLDLYWRSPAKEVHTIVEVHGDTLTLQNNDPGKARPLTFVDAVALKKTK